MARKCTVCAHPKVDEINRLLLENKLSAREIGRRYGLSDSAIRRHKANHLPERLKAAHDFKESLRAADLLDQLRALQEKALGILEAAEEEGSQRTALLAIKECRNNLALIGELLGEINRGPQVQVALIQNSVDKVAAIILPELDRCPVCGAPLDEIRLRIAEGLQSLASQRELPPPQTK